MANNVLVPGFSDEKDDSLKITLDKVAEVPNCLIVRLNGYIDTYNSNYFQKSIAKVVDAGYVNLIFNCSALNYVSSTGIGSFTAFLKLVKPKGGDIVLLEIQPKVFEVFQLLGFSQFFSISKLLWQMQLKCSSLVLRKMFLFFLLFFLVQSVQSGLKLPMQVVSAVPNVNQFLQLILRGRFL